MFGLRLKVDSLNPFDDLLKDKKFWSDFEKELAKELTVPFSNIFLAGVQAGAKVKVKTKAAADELPQLSDIFTAAELAQIAEDAIRAYVPTFTKGIADTTYERVRLAVLKARESGGGVEEVLKLIRPMFDEARAEMIAVTETTRLFGMGSQAVYQAQGITGWEWQTANDPWVDKQECVQLQGKTFPISEEFQPAHPRCRCWPAPVML